MQIILRVKLIFNVNLYSTCILENFDGILKFLKLSNCKVKIVRNSWEKTIRNKRNCDTTVSLFFIVL